MSLVGDVLLSARELMTDLPQTFPAPHINSGSATAGSGLGSATYYLVVTVSTPFGESLPSNEVPVTTSGGNQQISVVYQSNGPLSGLAKVRVYFGTTSGAQKIFQEFTTVNSPLVVTTLTGGVAEPPSRSTAYQPDTDGDAVGAVAIYRWLNQALQAAAAKNKGGIPDFGAVGTVSGQPIYGLNAYWKKIDSAWYDGYPLYLCHKRDVFRRNKVTGYVGEILVYQASDRMLAEVWPQPSRTSANVTLGADMAATATTATLASSGGWVLPFGLAMIGLEIVEYATLSGTTLSGITRGMCGTKPAAHSSGDAVVELNLMYSGMRVPSTYAVGDSLVTFYLPPGWDEAIMSYMLYRFRSAEQDNQGAQRYYQEFAAKMLDLAANRIIAGPRQIQAGAAGVEVAKGLGSIFGGVLVP